MKTMKKGAHKREMRKKFSGRLIDARVQKLGDWRGEMLSRLRVVMKQADPEIVEEVKWNKPTNPLGVAVWSRDGLICTCETYKNAVKMTFPKGASLEDPSHLFNSSLQAKLWRAIDIHEGEELNEPALKDLVRAAVALNVSGSNKKPPTGK